MTLTPHDPTEDTAAAADALDELTRSFAQLQLQQLARQAKAGDLCPRCVQRGNPRPGRLGPNMDHDLACHICGHVVYRS